VDNIKEGGQEGNILIIIYRSTILILKKISGGHWTLSWQIINPVEPLYNSYQLGGTVCSQHVYLG